MNQRNESLDTALLLMEMLKRIPHQRRVTAAELHKQLAAHGYERNIRTIQRHLDTLSMAFGLERDERNKPFGYRWRDKAVALSLPGLSAQESLLLHLAQQHLHALLPPQLMRSMEPYFDQAKRNLSAERGPSDASARSARQWLRKVRVVPLKQPPQPPKIAPEVFDEVSAALQDNRWLQLRYRDALQQECDVCAMPLGLIKQDTLLYLVCRFEGEDNARSLALHCMRAAEALSQCFRYPDNFDLAHYDVAGGLGDEAWNVQGQQPPPPQ